MNERTGSVVGQYVGPSWNLILNLWGLLFHCSISPHFFLSLVHYISKIILKKIPLILRFCFSNFNFSGKPTLCFHKWKQNINISIHSCVRSKDGSVEVRVFAVTATVYTPGVGFQQGRAFHHCRSEKSAGQMRGEVLMLPFKFLSPAPLTARIDLALPWIHRSRQQERMHKAHYSEHA